MCLFEGLVHRSSVPQASIVTRLCSRRGTSIPDMKHNATVEGSTGHVLLSAVHVHVRSQPTETTAENRCVSYNKIVRSINRRDADLGHIDRTQHQPLDFYRRRSHLQHAYICTERSHNNATEHSSHGQPKAHWYTVRQRLTNCKSNTVNKNSKTTRQNNPPKRSSSSHRKNPAKHKGAFGEQRFSLSETKAHENKSQSSRQSYNRISMGGATYTARRSNSTLRGMKKQKVFLPPYEGTLPRETLSRRESCAIGAQRSIPGSTG